ncbi:DUF1192 domain-containing protein [Sneathiella limimaris]|uniref:DUF1192 domain-containing protein n=1 Tax=Sneathiella limimaris TaxID=1964213 RepID=UPI00146C391A|nr:DUF1192 domain-containing protein [Sneathiella limimaris]
MTSDENDIPMPTSHSVNFETMSVEELKDYIKQLEQEIKTAESFIEKKKAAHVSADSFFKK